MSLPAFVPPPLDADAATFEDPSWAAPFQPYVSRAKRPVRVLAPCVGIDAPQRAAHELRVPWKNVASYDTNVALRPVLERLGDNQAGDPSLHIGKMCGDVMRVSLAELDLEVDGLVSGPPCPPFSSMGHRLHELDPRAHIFLTVCAWIIHLATHGKLSWWILENVSGMKKRRAGQDCSFAEWFLFEVRSLLPEGWQVQLLEANSCHCCLPQDRARIFFVGTSALLRQTPLQRRILAQPPLERDRVGLSNFLDPVSSPADYDSLTMLQQLHVMTQLEKFQLEVGKRDVVGVVDIARDPDKERDSAYKVDGVRCLRTNNKHLWLLPSRSLAAIYGEKGRLLSRSEKCRVCGVPPSSLRDLTESELNVALGNCIPVPLIGHILVPVLRAWQQSIS